MAIDVACFSDPDAVAADAGGALDRAHQPQLFDRLEWYRLILSHCPPPGTPLIVRARDAQGSAWLFLARQGRKASALANWYSLRTGLVRHGAVNTGLETAIAKHLREIERLSLIDLSPLREDQAATLNAAFHMAGWWSRRMIATVNWSISLADTNWVHFLDARPARLRNTLRRKTRLHQFTIRIITEFQDNDWDIYEEIYSKSWKPEEDSPAMLRALARQESLAGTLRLGIASAGDIPVAAQLWLVENGEASIHKLAHVEAWRAQSPGTLLTAAMFRYAIERDKVRRIDFGTGDDSYKADWMDQSHPLYRMRFYNPATLAGLADMIRDRLSAASRPIRRST